MYVFAFMQLGAWMVILCITATTSLNHCFLHHMFFTTGGATEQVVVAKWIAKLFILCEIQTAIHCCRFQTISLTNRLWR